MSDKTIGVTVMGRDADAVLHNIQNAEALGIPAVWSTSGGVGLDPMMLFSIAATRTSSIKMGTSIIPTWPRHPLALVQQVQVVEQLAPGRIRLGVGPSHQPTMETMFGVDFTKPLGHLREYVEILKSLLQQGSVEFNGKYYSANATLPDPADVPIMISALRSGSFTLAGEIADGAISWVCPGQYLKEVALPAMKAGAQKAGRSVPPLITHAPVCVSDDWDQVLSAARTQIANYPRLPFYSQMLQDAGYGEAREGSWSESMVDSVVLWGDEEEVIRRIQQLFDWGSTEIIVQPITLPSERSGSAQRVLETVARVANSME